MPQRQRQSDPDVSIQILLVGRAGRGIVMDVRPFDLGPVPLGGGVVDNRQQTVGQGQDPQHEQKKLRGDRTGLASEWGEEVIIVLEIVADSGGAEPTGDGPPADSKQYARQQHRQPPPVACVQPGPQPFAPLRPIVRTFPVCFRHPWLSCHLRLGKRLVTEEPFSCQDQFWQPNGLRPFFLRKCR